MPEVKKGGALLVYLQYTLSITLCNQISFFKPFHSDSNPIQNKLTYFEIIFNLEDDWHTVCSIVQRGIFTK